MMKKTLLILITTGLALIFFAAHSFAAGEAEVQIHGFVSQGYISTTENNFIADSKNGTFEFNEMGINFAKKLTGDLHIGMQLFAKDFGDTGNKQIKIDWALADYRIRDWLGLRFGQLKAPHGLYNEYRDIDTLRTFVFLPQSIYPEITRDVTLSIQGGGLYGLIDMHAAGRLSYQALYGTQTIDADNDRLTEALSGFPAAFVDNDTSDVDVKYAGSLSYDTPLSGLRLCVSYDNVKMSFSGHYNRSVQIFPEGTPISLDFDTSENWVFSLEYAWQNFMLMAEYMDTYRKYENLIDNSIVWKSEFEQTGWYVAGTYRFTDWLELGAYVSILESDTFDNLGDVSVPDYYNDLSDICLTSRFDINEFWLFKLEYHMFTGAKGLSAWDNPPSSSEIMFSDNFKEDWTMFAAKLTVAF